MAGSLNKKGNNYTKQVSKIIRMSLPKSNANIKSNIDSELNKGWRISSSMYLATDNDLLIIFTRPRNRK